MACGSSTIGALLALLLHAVGIGNTCSSRVPNPSVIGADLLVRTAGTCDMLAAWRIIGGRSFSPASLTQMGSAGETPLMAATRNGCSELVALIVLQPGFDDDTIRRTKSRRELANHATRNLAGNEHLVKWALAVVLGVRKGKVAKLDLEWDPKGAAVDQEWFLPGPNEWLPPMGLEAMGIVLPMRPALPEAAMQEMQMHSLMYTETREARLEDVIKLWYLLVVHLQGAEGSVKQSSAARHIRSIGWSLFFFGGHEALLGHQFFIKALASVPLDIPPDDDPLHDHLRAGGVNITNAYESLATRLCVVWNKTGDWVYI